MDDRGEAAFATLSAAERNSRSVQFTYEDKEGTRTSRTVDPYGFIVSSGRVYCVAYDHARNDMRTFAVDNITDATTLTKTFNKPQSFDVESFGSNSISGVLHHGNGSSTDVRVRFDARVAKAAVAARVVADREIERREDGSVDIKYRVADSDELVRWVLGWGPQAEIVSPDPVRLRAAELVGQISQRYN